MNSPLAAAQPQITILEPTVKSLIIRLQFNGQGFATGTAFVAPSPRGPVLITNRHNVTGRHQETGECLSKQAAIPNELVIAHHHTSQLGAWILRVEPLYDAAGNRLWIEHPSLGAKADFIALPLTHLEDVKLYPYTLGVGDPLIVIGPSEVVSVIGFPFGLAQAGAFAIWATGFVASEPSIDYDNLPVFLIDCRSRQGQSGSPVIAYRNGGAFSTEDGGALLGSGIFTRFLGIYSGRINAESDLGIVWKAAAIRELVASIR